MIDRDSYEAAEVKEIAMNARTLDRITTGWVSLVIAWMAGFFLMIPLIMIFNVMKWPFFNGWAIGHGSFIFAWPLLSWGALLGIRSLRKRENSG
jgi:hypothetical protein